MTFRLHTVYFRSCSQINVCDKAFPFKVGDNQRPERTGAGVQKPTPESSVPGDNLDRGSRRNQLRRGHGSPPVLSEVPHELSIPMRTPKSANGPRSNSFRPDSPFTTNFPRGRKTQSAPSPHRTWSVPDASSTPQLNLHRTVTLHNSASCFPGETFL